MAKNCIILSAVVAASALVSGCGVLPRVAHQTAAAAIAPVATTAQAVSQSLQATSHNLAVSSAAAQQTARQVSATAAQTRTLARNTARAAEQRRRQAARNAALRERIENSPAEPEPFDILPPAVLAQLTEKQAALQRIVQKEAFTAPVGETIFWEDSGRTGTAMTEEESPLGGFVCRTFVQTVRLNETEERGRAFSCKSLDGVWEPPLVRTELTQ